MPETIASPQAEQNTGTGEPIRIKVIMKGVRAEPQNPKTVAWDDCLFIFDAAVTDYDWLLVYDEVPKQDVGTIRGQTEPLQCPPDHTILITAEPAAIKIYSRAFTRQFGTVLTTHVPQELPHKNRHIGCGCLEWLYRKPLQAILEQTHFEKTKVLSTVCSAKQHKHTDHNARYKLTSYLAEYLPELDWFGYGVRELDNKTNALDAYKYHLCVENYIAPHHWTEKLADAFLGMTLPFYAGDPEAANLFPPGSFIPIPLHDPPAALAIIRQAIDNGEYEKRLPLIRQARQLILERYNMFAQTVAVIHAWQKQSSPVPGSKLKGRHVLRKNPFFLIQEGMDTLRYKIRRLLARK